MKYAGGGDNEFRKTNTSVRPSPKKKHTVEDIPEREEDVLVNMDPPTANEVESAIDNMKSEKALGADGVSAEMLKAGGDVITETITEIFKEIWEEEIPVDWKTRLIVKLPKNGNLMLCKNWRGITLLSITVIGLGAMPSFRCAMLPPLLVAPIPAYY